MQRTEHYGYHGNLNVIHTKGIIYREPEVVCMISGFRRKVDGNCGLLGYCTANSRKENYHYSLRNNPEQRSSLNYVPSLGVNAV
jgi:hypothetical protein